jgi:hypothetical protein
MARRRAQRQHAEQLDELQRRVHGDDERRCCGYCGRLAWVPPTSPVVEHVGLDGRARTYGVCPDDEHVHAGGSFAVVLAERLDLDPATEALAYVQVPTFAASPGARADRPNSVPWEHVDDRQLHAMVEQAAAELAAVTQAPCRRCGDVRRVDNWGLSDRGWCERCDWHLNRRFGNDDGARDYAACWLAGGPEQLAPRGFGRHVGLKFFDELDADRQRGARRPFDWHTDAEIGGWYRILHPLPPPPDHTRPAPRLVGRTMVTPRRRPKAPVPGRDPLAVVSARRASW